MLSVSGQPDLKKDFVSEEEKELPVVLEGRIASLHLGILCSSWHQPLFSCWTIDLHSGPVMPALVGGQFLPGTALSQMVCLGTWKENPA